MNRSDKATENRGDPAGSALPADRDVYCPGCMYNLRGVASRRCPECGRPFDLARLSVSQIPWVHRREIGRIGAFRKTVAMVMLRPRHLALEIMRPVSHRHAQRFRWTVIGFVLVTLGALAAAAVWCVHDKYALETRHTVTILLLPLLCAALAAIWTGLPSWFCAPKRLDREHRNRAISLSYYASGPLVLLVIPAACWAATFVSTRAVGGFATISLGLLIASVIGSILILLFWLTATLTVISTATRRSATGTVGIGLALLVLSLLFSTFLIGLPVAAVMYWLLMYYSLT